jgi:hypothetical protein
LHNAAGLALISRFSTPVIQKITPQLVSQLRRKRLARSKIQGRNKVEQQGKVNDQSSSTPSSISYPVFKYGNETPEEPLLANLRGSSKSSTSPSYGGDAFFRDRKPNTCGAKTPAPTRQSAFS